VITKILVSAAIALTIGVAAPATADPSAFSHLSCNCRHAVPANSPAAHDRIRDGIQAGLSDCRVSEASGDLSRSLDIRCTIGAETLASVHRTPLPPFWASATPCRVPRTTEDN
jgi:hypothetical protein